MRKRTLLSPLTIVSNRTRTDQVQIKRQKGPDEPVFNVMRIRQQSRQDSFGCSDSDSDFHLFDGLKKFDENKVKPEF